MSSPLYGAAGRDSSGLHCSALTEFKKILYYSYIGQSVNCSGLPVLVQWREYNIFSINFTCTYTYSRAKSWRWIRHSRNRRCHHLKYKRGQGISRTWCCRQQYFLSHELDVPSELWSDPNQWLHLQSNSKSSTSQPNIWNSAETSDLTVPLAWCGTFLWHFVYYATRWFCTG